jgi:hypothetical protein
MIKYDLCNVIISYCNHIVIFQYNHIVFEYNHNLGQPYTGATALTVTDPSVADILVSPPRTTGSWSGVLVLLTRVL